MASYVLLQQTKKVKQYFQLQVQNLTANKNFNKTEDNLKPELQESIK